MKCRITSKYSIFGKKGGDVHMSNKKNYSNRITVDRSAKTGRFVTREQVKRSPATTEQERYRRNK